MNEDELKRRVEQIIAESDDPEIAHAHEDDLHMEIVEAFCPAWVVKEIERLGDADFPR